MAKLLFNLHQVPEEEANAVRQILDDHQISCYETNAGRWGISVAAIWLVNEDDYPEARALIDGIQAELAEHEPVPTRFADKFRERPVDVVLAAVAIAIVLGLTLWPFMTAFEGL